MAASSSERSDHRVAQEGRLGNRDGSGGQGRVAEAGVTTGDEEGGGDEEERVGVVDRVARGLHRTVATRWSNG